MSYGCPPVPLPPSAPVPDYVVDAVSTPPQPQPQRPQRTPFPRFYKTTRSINVMVGAARGWNSTSVLTFIKEDLTGFYLYAQHIKAKYMAAPNQYCDDETFVYRRLRTTKQNAKDESWRLITDEDVISTLKKMENKKAQPLGEVYKAINSKN